MNGNTICLINDSFPPAIDGVANVVVNYARNIQERHGSALVVTPNYPNADDSEFPFPVLRYPSIDTRQRLGYMTGFPFSPELANRLHSAKAELLHCHCPMTSALLAREFRSMLDVPLVFTYHTKYDIDVKNALHSHLLRWSAIRAMVRNISSFDEVWVVSRGAGENLRSLGYEGDYHVMENGVDIPRGRLPDEAVAEAVSGYDLPKGVPVFLFVGRIMWYKGLHIILDALAALAARGVDFRTVFIGDGTDEEDVRATASSLGLDGRCIFTGPIRNREAVRAWYCRSDIFLFPSTFDTNGLVVREAAACSLPSVLIRDSCAAEGILDGHNGYLIDEDADSLADVLERLCRDLGQVRAVGECASRELYISWTESVDRAVERYGVIIENYRAGLYPKRRKPMDGFFRAQGQLMKVLGGIGSDEEPDPPAETYDRQNPLNRLISRLRRS